MSQNSERSPTDIYTTTRRISTTDELTLWVQTYALQSKIRVSDVYVEAIETLKQLKEIQENG